MQTTQLKILGMTCGKCALKIENTIRSIALNLHNIKVTKNPDLFSASSNKAINPSFLNQIFETNNLSKYKAVPMTHNLLAKQIDLITPQTYKRLWPLFLILSYILMIVLAVAFLSNNFSMGSLMNHYMGGFFIIFSFFKFLNLKGFTEAFSTYDPIASKFQGYGYLYAIFELNAGLSYLLFPESLLLNIMVITLLGITSIGVFKAVTSKRAIQCACLGIVFNLPMTYVTTFENTVMILMALTNTYFLIIN